MDFAIVEQEYGALYSAHDPPGKPVLLDILPFTISNEVPEKAEIAEHVMHLKNRKAAGPSGMRAEHLKVWCENGSQSWLDFVRVVQECFTTGEIPKAMCFSTLVLIPKADGSLQGIGLLEVAWKVVSGIVQQRLQASIEFEDSLHGF